MRTGGNDMHRRKHVACRGVSFLAVDEEATHEFLNRCDDDVALDRLRQEQAFRQAIFRHIGDAAGNTFLNCFRMDVLAIDTNSAGKIRLHAEECQCQFCTA